MTAFGSKSHRKAPGFVLVGVLIVVMLLSMIALSLMFRMRSEETAGATGSTAEQGWATAMSGVREAMRLVPTIQPGDITWMDAPERFKDRVMYNDGTEEWRWTLYSANPEGGIRVGLTDEGSRLNLNSATTSMVSRLPGMKPSLTDALLDFLDTDDVPRPEGAEQEYYNALPQPYRIHNGPLSTVEQLLLVRGFTPALVLGEDANRNFSLDPNEDDGDEREPPDDADGRLQPGLLPLLTVYSREPNTDRTGKRRFNLNTPGAALTETNDLPAAFVAFVAQLGASKSVVMDPAELLDATFNLKGPDGQDRPHRHRQGFAGDGSRPIHRLGRRRSGGPHQRQHGAGQRPPTRTGHRQRSRRKHPLGPTQFADRAAQFHGLDSHRESGRGGTVPRDRTVLDHSQSPVPIQCRGLRIPVRQIPGFGSRHRRREPTRATGLSP